MLVAMAEREREVKLTARASEALEDASNSNILQMVTITFLGSIISS